MATYPNAFSAVKTRFVDGDDAKAQSLLEEGKRPISEICFMVGFSSPSYFSRCFDKKFGMTPHAWMNNRRKA